MPSKKVEVMEPIIEVNDSKEDDIYTFEMLAGYEDENGIVHTTFTLREMTGKDEEAISRPDVKGNHARVISLLLSRVCTSIGTLTPRSVGGIAKWENIIKSLYVGDQDYMIMKARSISFGDDLSLVHTCPNQECGRELTTELTLDELEIVPFNGNRIIEFTLPKGYKDKKGKVHKEGKLRLPNGLDRELLVPIARTNMAKGNTAMLVRCCTFNDGYPVTDDVMSALVVRDRKYLGDLLNSTLFGIKTSIPITCPDCGTTFEGAMNIANFI